VPDGRSLSRRFRPDRQHVVRYVVHEPSSAAPLSDGEIDRLVNGIAGSLDRWRSELERLELFFRDARREGRLNALLYLFGILTVRWYWWIFITLPEASLYNLRNAVETPYASATRNVLARFWERGRDSATKEALDEAVALYAGMATDPLSRYRELRACAASRAAEARSRGDGARERAWLGLLEAYRAVIEKHTGRSLLTRLLPTNFRERLGYYAFRSFEVPPPERVHAARNLSKDIRDGAEEDFSAHDPPVLGANGVDGNALELYLLATKRGDPVCVLARDANQALDALVRAESIADRGLPLSVSLHVGTERERRALVGFDGGRPLYGRLRNAALDTSYRAEALTAYYYRELSSAYQKGEKYAYPFRSRLHLLFPWLFITNGIPVASALAAVWLFVDPYYAAKRSSRPRAYFSNILDGVQAGYRDVVLRVRKDAALGYVNRRIREDEGGRAYRDIILELGELALPPSILDRAIVDELATETAQLSDFRREADDFTTVPLSFVAEPGLRGLGQVLGDGA